MRILFLGDVVGRSGCLAVTENLPVLIKNKKIDFVIINDASDQIENFVQKIKSENSIQ